MPRKAKRTSAKKAPVIQESSTPQKPFKSLNLDKKNLRVVLVVIVVAGLLVYLKGLFIAATVNGRPISRLEVVNELEKQSGKAVLDSLVSRSLIYQEAQKRNISVSDKDVDAEMQKIEKSVSSEGQSFDQVLAAQNLTREELKNRIKTQLLVEKMLKDKVKVSDDEVAKFMESNKDTLPTGLSDDELKKGSREQLESQKLDEAAQQLLTELKQKAKINYFVSY